MLTLKIIIAVLSIAVLVYITAMFPKYVTSISNLQRQQRSPRYQSHQVKEYNRHSNNFSYACLAIAILLMLQVILK